MENRRQTVKTDSYSSEFQRLTQELIAFERETLVSQPTNQIDVFGNFWSIAFSSSLPEGRVSIGRQKSTLPLVGSCAAFLPPHSVIQWHLRPGMIPWRALISFQALPPDLPKEPVAFLWDEGEKPASVEEIFSLVRKQKNIIPIGKEDTPNAVANRAKAYLDEHFMESIPLAEVAKRLKYAHAVMDRNFKANYGLSPIVYRNKKRILTASMLMLLGNYKIANIGQEVGFIDLSRFHKQFRKIMNATPSQFRFGNDT